MNFAEALKTTDDLNAPSTTANPEKPTDVLDPNASGAGAPPATPPADPPADATQQSQNQNTPPADVAAPNAGTVDYDKYFDEMSGGLIKNVDGFKAVLPRLAEYDTLKSETERLSAEMAKAPKFADDEVRILNDLKASGASKDQIKSFHKINEYGAITEMPDRDALIAKMVMVDGVKPSVAELKIDRDFKLKNEDLNDDEKEILADDMRVAAVNARKELEKFKAQVSTTNQLPPEELQLQQTAQIQEFQGKLKPYVKEVMQSIPNLGSFYLSGKEGEADAVQYEIPIDDALRGQLGQYVENYFMDGLTEVNPENTRLAIHYARAEYIREHLAEIVKNAFDHGISVATEKLTNKYENRSGLKPPGDNPLINSGDQVDSTLDYMTKRVNRVGQ